MAEGEVRRRAALGGIGLEPHADLDRSQASKLEGVLQLERVQVLERLVERALALVADKDQTQSNYAQLHEMRDFLAFLEVEIPGLIARWQALRAAMPSQAATARPDDIPNRGGTR